MKDGSLHIHFIVNPIAGKGGPPLSKQFLEQFFVSGLHHLSVKHSTFKKHAIALTQKSIEENADIIVACGGDGTINEVASCLVGSSIPLGIVPIGSGNGLATNLSIPKNIRKALEIIKNQNSIKIDVGKTNDKYFFCNTGVGFDASVIKNYESLGRRTLSGYLRACLTSFQELGSPQKVQININGLNFPINPFMIFASNSNEMGYRFTLTPNASLQDGLLDVLVITKIGKLKILWLGLLLLLNRPYLLKESRYFQTNHLELHSVDGGSLDSQVDGELHLVEDGMISIQIVKKAIEVIVPSNIQE
ncbi:NAD(+)/NADH kinase [Flavobacteriaceae bacterium F89]|uniref:NAD(+)/NADH kinase n=1 Tax=Cerina litoralis TaxID=2874477 RepID=A0AAE3EVE0_9FLAO|nr:diacylglycerol kinase family protein [Cerina litoralis]MCG2460371.1 NAD(+)/NADH kinase [Cerina litoralis]